jgi:hypothetical protein
MLNEQDVRELQIFSLFAQVCPLAIRSESIEKRQPCEPDILCETSEGSVAFEMGESIDEDFARQAADIEIQSQLEDAFRNLPSSDCSELRNRLGNARVTVLWHPQVSKQKRRNAILPILKSLQHVSPSFTGIHRLEAILRKRKAKERVIEGVIIVRDNSSGGPYFDQPPSGWLDDPTLNLVEQKFDKEYISSTPIELLIYYQLPPVLPERLWSELRALLEQCLQNSRFRRVWVFDAKKKMILFVYPSNQL